MTPRLRRALIRPRGVTSLLPFAFCAALSIASGGAGANGQTPAQADVTRCGWFENPSPGNASLTDRHGEWTIAVQGEPSAKGKWPKFQPSQWVRTGHGSAGYGCACLEVTENRKERNITTILSANVRPLSVCRRDKALKEPAGALR